jgi:hypothetical protein
MSKPTNTDDELDALRQQVLVEFKQVLKLSPSDYTENCTNVVMSIIQAYTEKQVRDAEIQSQINFIREHQEHNSPGAGSIEMSSQWVDEVLEILGRQLKAPKNGGSDE